MVFLANHVPEILTRKIQLPPTPHFWNPNIMRQFRVSYGLPRSPLGAQKLILTLSY